MLCFDLSHLLPLLSNIVRNMPELIEYQSYLQLHALLLESLSVNHISGCLQLSINYIMLASLTKHVSAKLVSYISDCLQLSGMNDVSKGGGIEWYE